MTQIRPRNGFWRGYVARFDELAGLDLESTTNCLRAAAKTLQFSRNRCLGENYKTNWAQAMWTRYHYGDRCWLSPHAFKRTYRMKQWEEAVTVQMRDAKAEEKALLGFAFGSVFFAWLGVSLFRGFTPKEEPFVVEYISPKLDPVELRNL